MTSAAAPAEPGTRAPFGRRAATVVARESLGAYRLLRMDDTDGPPDPHAGQFYMLAAAERWGSDDGRPYLPRAFSHARVERGGEASARGGASEPGFPFTPELSFLLDAVGPGTERLGELEPGERVWIAGPFGVGFRLDPDGAGGNGAAASLEGRRRSLLAGGGIGVAPILALADALAPEATTLLGFRSADHAAAAELFPRTPALATDDGSAGRHALVTELLAEELDADPAATVYACGPPPMLEAVRSLCETRGAPAQLALESGMACGYGACFGCVVPTRDGFVRLCLDGPVLDAARLDTALFEGAGH
jgi:dihydroorotate dehydrogenase electron transfer subunit